MATAVRSGTSQPFGSSSAPREDRAAKRKKEQRTEIWSNLLRQTREAQARSRTQAVQHRELIVCGGSPADQRAFAQDLARPPPPAPPSRNRDQRPQKAKGEVKLSNRYAYGYGHVTLYSPPQQNAGMLSAESEELAHVEMHTLPDPDMAYEQTLRRLLEPKRKVEGNADADVDEVFAGGDEDVEAEHKKPAVSVLLSWKEPWQFLALLRAWLQLLARALLPPNSPLEDPLEVLKEYKLPVTVFVQHVEAQEGLEREGYREESFDFISQCLRTCILPLSAALVYMSSSLPPQQPGSALSETQKILYTSLSLDLGPLSPAPAKSSTPAKRDDLVPKHNVVDRMAIVVPSGWDSAGKIRLLSETFSPESLLESWTSDLNTPLEPSHQPEGIPKADGEASEEVEHTNGGAERRDEQEVYATSDAGEEDAELAARPLSPSKQSLSAISTYEQAIIDPNAHKAPKPPQIEVTTKPDQQFLAEMRARLQELETQDAERAKTNPNMVSSTAGSSTGRVVGLPSGEQTGALNELGDVSFNVGGVSYNTVSAEAAIERLKRPTPATGLESPSAASPRVSTPRPPKREDREASGTPTATPRDVSSTSTRSADLPVADLEAYFRSLMKKSDSGSGHSTPK